MEEVELITSDVAAENVARLAELLPAVATKAIDAEGRPQVAIDFDAPVSLLLV